MSRSESPKVNYSPGDLVDLVREDTGLRPEEKETLIRFPKDRDRAVVYSAEAGIMRRLLAHPEFEVLDLETENGAEVESVQQLHAAEDSVVGVRGTIPIGAIKVSACSRSAAGHAEVVSRGGDERE